MFERDGVIEGLSAGDPRDGSIWALFVDPAHEGRGVGRMVFAKACQSLREQGHTKLTLSTEAGSRAERFYRMDGWVPSPVNDKGEVVFTKRFPPLNPAPAIP